MFSHGSVRVRSWFGVPGGHVDVIMKVLSWFGSQSFIREDVIMNVRSFVVRSHLSMSMSS